MKKNLSNQRIFGFTLLELLVVMAIIGILAAIGIASYGGVQAKARDARRKSDLESIARALEMYRNDFGRYPNSSASGGKIQGHGGTAGSATYDWGGSFTINNQIYMQELPKDTKFGYLYEVTNDGGTGKGYRLYARLENLEDVSIPRIGANPTTYQGMQCGTQGCNYFVRSASNVADPDVVP